MPLSRFLLEGESSSNLSYSHGRTRGNHIHRELRQSDCHLHEPITSRPKSFPAGRRLDHFRFETREESKSCCVVVDLDDRILVLVQNLSVDLSQFPASYSATSCAAASCSSALSLAAPPSIACIALFVLVAVPRKTSTSVPLTCNLDITCSHAALRAWFFDGPSP